MKSRIDRNIFARGAEPAPAEQQQSVRSTSVSSGVLQEIEGLLEDIRAGKLTSRAVHVELQERTGTSCGPSTNA